MKGLIVSPHLDDAALSCAARIESRQVEAVTTIFAGLPSELEHLSDWDILTRANSARTRVAERRAEDAAAWNSLGINYSHRDNLEARGDRIDPTQLKREIEQVSAGFARVFIPAGIGRHPQHVLVRDAALLAIAPGTQVVLYGELPYAAYYGWPEVDKHLDVEAHWRAEMKDISRGIVGPPNLVALNEAQRAFKRKLLANYTSQISAISGGSFKLFDTTTMLDFELEFNLVI